MILILRAYSRRKASRSALSRSLWVSADHPYSNCEARLRSLISAVPVQQQALVDQVEHALSPGRHRIDHCATSGCRSAVRALALRPILFRSGCRPAGSIRDSPNRPCSSAAFPVWRGCCLCRSCCCCWQASGPIWVDASRSRRTSPNARRKLQSRTEEGGTAPQFLTVPCICARRVCWSFSDFANSRPFALGRRIRVFQ